MFFDERSAYLVYLTTVPEEIIITGDLNFQIDNSPNLVVSQQLDFDGLTPHVIGATHTRDHALDVVKARGVSFRE